MRLAETRGLPWLVVRDDCTPHSAPEPGPSISIRSRFRFRVRFMCQTSEPLSGSGLLIRLRNRLSWSRTLCRPVEEKERVLTSTGPTWKAPTVAEVLRSLPFLRHTSRHIIQVPNPQP